VTASAYDGRPVLVTGGLGFIGSNLAIRLVELGADVTVADALIPDLGGNPFNIAPLERRIRVVNADMRDADAVEGLVQGQEVVFSLAGQVSHVDSLTDPVEDLELNYRTQLVVLEALRRRNPEARVVYAGSRQQYGRPQSLPVDESHPLKPIDANGIHKAAAESAMLLYHRIYGLPTSSLRLTNTYGPRMQMRHPRQGFVSWFVRLAVEGREIELFGGGESLRDFNAVDDVVEAFLLCGERDEAVGEVFNLGHPEPVSIRAFAELLLGLAGDGALTERPFPPDRERIDIGSVYLDFSRIRERLGWQPRVGLEDGLRRTLEYYRAHRDRYW
jgi:UDP-glucose 4-epimerase